MGGALAMNAGAFGSETWDIVTRVKTVNRTGEIKKQSPDVFSIGYRSVQSSSEEWFVSAELTLQQDYDKNAEKLLKESLTQLGYTNIGSQVIRKRNSKKELFEYCVYATWKENRK